MATDSSAIGALGGSTTQATTATKKTTDINSNEFMNLLVAQLKNQDPLNPMDNQQFAVQLAQFSQLEQLVSINDKVGKQSGSTGDLASLASYLGHEVVTSSSTATVTNHDGGSVAFTLPSGAENVQIQLLDENGRVVESKDAGPQTAGKHSVSLSGLTTASGSYKVNVEATTGSSKSSVPGYIAGIVSGVIPGADPKLIVNGSEISTGEVTEVRIPSY